MDVLNFEAAQALITSSMDRAKGLYQRPICVAVVDATGLLMAFARMDGAPARSIAIAQGKAFSAVRMGTSTQAFLARLQREGLQASYFCDPVLTPLPGGTPLKLGSGAVVGGVGVSGLAVEEDQQLSDALAAEFGK